MRGSVRVQRFKLRANVRLAPKVFLLVGLLIAGCTPQPDLSVEEQVGNRALQWANALISLDYDKALTFMTPSYQNSPRADRFNGEFSGAGFWKDAEIKWVKCDEASSAALEQGDVGTADSAVGTSKPADTMTSDTIIEDSEDECVVTSWETCGQTFAKTSAPISSSVDSSVRCDVRLTLSVMKPPEMSMSLPIPYEAVWLNIDGIWYMYRQ
jgi:hypothetical protein